MYPNSRAIDSLSETDAISNLVSRSDTPEANQSGKLDDGAESDCDRSGSSIRGVPAMSPQVLVLKTQLSQFK